MINRITEIYIDALVRYINLEKNNIYKREAQDLLTKMDIIDTLDALEYVIKSSGVPIPTATKPIVVTATTSSSNISFFEIRSNEEPTSIDQLVTIIMGIQNEIDTRRALHSTCCLELACDGNNMHLCNLIRQIIDDPLTLMHYDAVSLMNYLTDNDSLMEVFKYLQTLPLIEKPSAPKPGSFDYKLQGYQDPDVIGCLTLLRSNAQFITNCNYDLLTDVPQISTNLIKSAHTANLLLQKLLIIYHDLHTVPATRAESTSRTNPTVASRPERCAIQ